MKYTNEDINLENGIQKEWIITNGIGGFASSTIIGANTRKYHGLLIAPLTPPARRYLILSKVDESIEIGGKQYNLYTNIGKNYIAKGYEYQTSFEKEEIPTLKYKISDVEITKQTCMKYGENTVGILYKICGCLQHKQLAKHQRKPDDFTNHWRSSADGKRSKGAAHFRRSVPVLFQRGL